MEHCNDFADLEVEIYDWQDDMLIPASDDEESERNFRKLINSKFDF